MAQAHLLAAQQAPVPKHPADPAAIPHPNKKSVRTAPNTKQTSMTWTLLISLRGEVGESGADGRQGPGVGPQMAGARAQAGAEQPAMLLHQQ